MPTPTLERVQGIDTTGFDNFSALHSLTLALETLDTRKREELQAMLGQFRLPTYEVPDGYIIQVEPDYKENPDRPLYLEQYTDRTLSWRHISSLSQHYHRVVQFYGELGQVFKAHRLEQDDRGKIFARNVSLSMRVAIGNTTTFNLVELEGSM